MEDDCVGGVTATFDGSIVTPYEIAAVGLIGAVPATGVYVAAMQLVAASPPEPAPASEPDPLLEPPPSLPPGGVLFAPRLLEPQARTTVTRATMTGARGMRWPSTQRRCPRRARLVPFESLENPSGRRRSYLRAS